MNKKRLVFRVIYIIFDLVIINGFIAPHLAESKIQSISVIGIVLSIINLFYVSIYISKKILKKP